MSTNPVVRLLQATPHAAYGAAWSPDGTRLAVCGGFLYGGGFLRVLDGARRTCSELSGKSLLIALGDAPETAGVGVILSSLCWDDAGGVLLASACSYKWDARPPLLFDFDGDSGLSVRGAPGAGAEGSWNVDGHATGCWLHRGRTVLRSATQELSQCLTVIASPLTEGLHACERRSALQNARLAVIDDVVYSPKNMRRVYSDSGTGPPLTATSEWRLVLDPHGLAHVDLAASGASPGLAPLPYGERVYAVVRDPRSAVIFGGLSDCTIVCWNVLARGVVERAGSWVHPRGADPRDGILVRGITALCFLSDGETLVSADRAGAVRLWRGGKLVASAQIPDGYSPRSLAAHPTAPRVAVGCKSPRHGYLPGAVFLVSLEGG